MQVFVYTYFNWQKSQNIFQIYCFEFVPSKVFLILNDITKITTVNSLKHIAKIEQTRERDTKPSTLKNISLPREQNKNISQNNKKIIKDIKRGEGIRMNKWIKNCYF